MRSTEELPGLAGVLVRQARALVAAGTSCTRNGVASLMVGDGRLFLDREDARLFLEAGDHPLNRRLKVRQVDKLGGSSRVAALVLGGGPVSARRWPAPASASECRYLVRASCGDQSGLVADVGDVGAGKPGRESGQPGADHPGT